MIDLSTFLMRWFFLCGLMRDGPEIQTLPYQPFHVHTSTSTSTPLIQQNQQNQQQQEWQQGSSPDHPEPYPPPQSGSGSASASGSSSSVLHTEESWRSQCLHGILSYPPGSQRELVMDAMRCELVQQLGHFFQSTMTSTTSSSTSTSATNTSSSWRLPIAQEPPDLTTEHTQEETFSIMMRKQQKKQIRDCLPQLVSAVLRSPQPTAHLVDPVHQLRHLILQKCQQDPSWGIELCWLLEAEVGRSWKNMFEHLQQPGKRLIIAFASNDKAAAIAKIGVEKREAFDLLQDVETVTAYGTPPPGGQEGNYLPSSMSLQRCSHFGDTMQFIDRLTQISMDLRRVPAVARMHHLQECLYEMNRRLRRRMVTRGQVSLDVEDNLGPTSWPELKDMTLDMVQHSVHFPLVPNMGTWPAGAAAQQSQQSQVGGVVRVLNIVVPQARLLSSRERCPYLVRLEIAETGLEGSDARLYATAPDLGLTVTEALASSSYGGTHDSSNNHHHHHPCDIPHELLATPMSSQQYSQNNNSTTSVRGGYQHDDEHYNGGDAYDSVVRQQQYEQLHHHMQQHHDQQQQPMTQQQQQQLQQQQQYQNGIQNGNGPPQSHLERPVVTLGEALLTRVFGKPWKVICDEVRNESPYGHVKGWQLASFILKAGEDIRQEALVMQMISKFKEWFEAEIPEATRPFLRPYTIMCVGGDAGLVECLTDAKSVDEVKKVTDGFISLRDYFERAYGPPGQHRSYQQQQQQSTGGGAGLTFEQAQDNFLRSLVGYSLVCYVLQIKDRHNANLLLDREGHIMHIDFGYVLGDMPKMAYVPTFTERAPFKLSDEFWEVLGGWNVKQGGLGVRFCKMFEEAFACASAHSDELAAMVEGIMLTLKGNPAEARRCANSVRANLRMRGAPNSAQQKMFIRELIATAQTSWTTSSYDWLQRQMNGYL